MPLLEADYPIGISVSAPAPLWSITATGTDRHLITKNATYFSLPTLTWYPDA